MAKLSIDIETYCELDIRKVGAYRYADHESFEVLLIAFQTEDEILGRGPTQIIDLAAKRYSPELYEPHMDELMEDFTEALSAADHIKLAFNANFERTCLAKHYSDRMPPEEWRCTMVMAMELGLPRSLGAVAEVLKLEQQKMKAGKALIQYFCKPCKPTKANGGRTRNLPHHDPERWELFKTYCIGDVDTEVAIRDRLSKYPLIDSELALWCADQRINDRGVQLDYDFIKQALRIDAEYKDTLRSEAEEITGLDNVNSLAQLKEWIDPRVDLDIFDIGLTKATVPKIIKAAKDPNVIRVLEIRSEMAKTSTSKYDAMDRAICSDDRARGLLQFYGANRTGRWAGRLVQVQNLPQNKIEDLDLARSLVYDGHGDILETIYGNVPMILSQLIRTAFVPKAGHKFYVADFSAIEARGIAWLAGEEWRMEVFRTHGKIYEASASQMFKVPIETITKDGENYALRAKGKIAELALGYGGAKGALEVMGALNMGLTANELPGLVTTWRNTNPKITALWWAVGNAALAAVRNKGQIQETHGIKFIVESGILFIELLNGRRLAYVNPRIEPDPRFNKDQLTYEGMDQTKGKWTKLNTYGPKLVENIIQAICRDFLAYSMLKLEEAGYNIVMHVHDEVIIEHSDEDPDKTMADIERIMGQAPEWAEGLPLNADGYYCEFYKKD